MAKIVQVKGMVIYMPTYPTGVKIFIDEQDATKWIFGTDTITLSNLENTWRNIDITSFIKGPGLHTIEITAEGGVGRVETRLEIS